MTTGNESDPRDDALAKAWRAQSQDLPPPALDATILAAAHRAVGSGPRDAGKQATEATRPQRWWMPLAAAATIGVVVIGILQIAPQAPVDIVIGERADVAGRIASTVPAAPMKDAASGSVVAQSKEIAPTKEVERAEADAPSTAAPSIAVPAPVAREKKATANVAPAPAPPPPPAAATDARKQVVPVPSMPAPEPFPVDKLPSKADAQPTPRENERQDAMAAQRAPAPSPAPAPMVAQAPAPPVASTQAPSILATAPMKKESVAGASGSFAAADNAAKPATAARERDAVRDESSARNAPAAASSELARSTASPAEWQARARDPDAWIARIRKLRADGRVAEADNELREFRRYVPDAETRLPADLRQWVPIR